MSLAFYFHTLRHLRPVQVYGRLWFKLNPVKPDVRPGPVVRPPSGEWLAPVERSASMRDGETFCFLNAVGHVRCAADWNDPGRARLWLYNLHYFDDLNAMGAAERVSSHRLLIARWVAENPPGVGSGWEPYPTSLRIVNWIKWSLAGNALEPDWMQSLVVQVRWLRKHLEYHLLGNHLFANAKALVFAGVFFTGSEADQWLRKGLQILERELGEQILSDGGHFERSPMYHATLIEDILDLINLAGLYSDCFVPALRARLCGIATRMLRWLRVMTHPDGKFALFNDAALEIAPEYAVLAGYARRLAVPVEEGALGAIEALPDSGYVRLQNARAVVICDVARVGPDYLPAHAHADTLSFELSLDGRRVLVNGGTSTYEPGPERQRQRGTAAHNTLVVDGQDSSEVWGGFRVARRARPFAVRWGEEAGTLRLEGAHDGYRRLRGRVVHWRRWVLRPAGLEIEDRAEGRFGTARPYLHLHPDVEARADERASAGIVLQMNGCDQIRVSTDPLSNLALADSTWHPEFGKTLESKTVTACFRGESLVTCLSW